MKTGLRTADLKKILKNEPSFRIAQINDAIFDPKIKTWSEITTLPKSLIASLQEIPFISVETEYIESSKDNSTHKAILKLHDGAQIEAVLMKNARQYWTLCISAQVGCAMRCDFCATGKMGLTRSLETEEIVDQLRAMQIFLAKNPDQEQNISNIVYMGMGEPMANYNNIKASLNQILKYTEIGKTHITVSSVGILPRLEQTLEDKDWPHVRMAISLHSADKETRQAIIPTSYPDFLPKLRDWAKRYLEKFGNRSHHLTFEYVMLYMVNDTEDEAIKLANYANSIGKVKVNLIPYNYTDTVYKTSSEKRIKEFESILKEKGIDVTIRHSKGQEIKAACGQLIKENKK